MSSARSAVATSALLALLCGWIGRSVEAQHPDSQNPDSQTRSPVGQWRLAGSMHERREYAGGVRLEDGRILAVSGHPLDGKSIASAELYDPTTDQWTVTGALRQARNSGNTTVLLNDGRVLLPGGNTNTEAILGAEIYHPGTGKWSDAGNLSAGRDTKATLLADGRVLVAGGVDWIVDGGKAFDLTEIYDPKTGHWSATGSLRHARYAHQLVLLDDGRVLAVGGYRDGDVLLSTTELYDPKSGTWQLTGELPTTRVAFGLVKLAGGRVLLAGGFGGPTWKQRSNLAGAALYDPTTGRWTETSPLKERRAGLSMIELPDGQVLVAGGWAQSQMELKSAELFDPRTNSWRPAASMNVARRNHRAALLRDGSVLVIGGSSGFGGKILTSCEIFSLSP
jgi:N-acetylneuraminic acid mutarotase